MKELLPRGLENKGKSLFDAILSSHDNLIHRLGELVDFDSEYTGEDREKMVSFFNHLNSFLIHHPLDTENEDWTASLLVSKNEEYRNLHKSYIIGSELFKFMNYMVSDLTGTPYFGEMVFPTTNLRLMEIFLELKPTKFVKSKKVRTGEVVVVGSAIPNVDVVHCLPKSVTDIQHEWESVDTGSFPEICSKLEDLAKENWCNTEVWHCVTFYQSPISLT